MGERSANRDADEQGANRGVFECVGAVLSKIAEQHECGQGHGGRLGDKRAQQGNKGHQHEIPGCEQIQGQPGGDNFNQVLGRHHNGFAGRNHHNGKHKQWLGVIAGVGVVHGLAKALGENQPCKKNHGPQAEDGLDLAQQVKDPMMRWVAVTELRKQADREGVQYRDGE